MEQTVSVQWPISMAWNVYFNTLLTSKERTNLLMDNLLDPIGPLLDRQEATPIDHNRMNKLRPSIL